MGARGPSSEANTTNNNTSTSNTTTGDIGFTGANARDILTALFGTTERTLTSAGNQYAGTLNHLADASSGVQLAGFSFAQGAIDRSATLFERSELNATSTLNGVVNAARDFSQRALSASTGQATPLQELAGASQYAGTAPGSDHIWIIAGVAIAAVALLMKD